jgi:potassium-transporting ATPase KdpC subunit
MTKLIKTSLIFLAIFIVITGLFYPLLFTGLAQIVFPYQANGSLIIRDQKVLGSVLIGQYFTDPKYFWGRPSATAGFPYNASFSGGSNLGPLNPSLQSSVADRIDAYHKADPQNTLPIPIDLLTASASGLDPHISLSVARYQSARVARVRGLSPDSVNALIDRYTLQPDLGILGEVRVNVLLLNLALDGIK